MAQDPTTLELRARYRAMAEALARVEARELAEMTDEEALRRTLSLSRFTDEPLPPSDWSGLVEQQALFHGIPLPLRR